MLEGRITILVEGTPFVLIVPALFVQFFQSSEDYYQRSDFCQPGPYPPVFLLRRSPADPPPSILRLPRFTRR
ncbi:spore germination protein [Paenibacillus rhizoplanae]